LHLFFQARDKLREDNEKLKAILKSKDEQVGVLKTQLVSIRKNTVSFILEQMEALHIQRDSQVWSLYSQREKVLQNCLPGLLCSQLKVM